MNVIDPRGIEVVEWTNQMALELTGISLPPRLERPEDWQHWALYVIQSPKIAKVQAPDPRTYDDWREWAFRFNQAVYAVRP